MRFQIDNKTFEIGNGHEIQSCFMTFTPDGDVASVNIMHAEGNWTYLVGEKGVYESGPRPVGLYELKAPS